MLIGTIGIYFFNYQNYKPDWLQFDVFTVYSSFLTTKTFTFIRNNQGDEISTLVFFFGAFLIIASSEKSESSVYQANRIRAMALAAVLSMIIFLLEYFLLHGMAITFAALLLPYLIPIFYLAGYYILNKRGDT